MTDAELPEGTGLKDFDLGPIVRVDGDSYTRVAEHNQVGMNVFFALRITPKRRMVEKDMVQSTWQERRILLELGLKHTFMTQFLTSFQDEENLYMVSEFINGGTIFRHLRMSERFNRHRARIYAAQMVLAIEFLHANNIVHRNLKPENLWVSSDGFIKLAGFEIAKVLKPTEKTCTLCGTPEYMAPEVLLHKGYTAAVDWWALGILLFEMILGQPPFIGRNEMDLFRRIIASPPQFQSLFFAEEKDIIVKLLHKKPTSRMGATLSGADGVKSHPFFESIQWEDIAAKQSHIPGVVPAVFNNADLQHFDVVQLEDWEDKVCGTTRRATCLR